MKTLNPTFAIVLVLAMTFASKTCAGEKSATERAAAKIAPVYTVSTYDPKRNPEDDLKMTVQKAKAEGKRILIQTGGNWCGWCKLMSQYFHEDERVAAALAKNYLIMKVNFSPENRNEAFLKKYPPAQGYPHLYVLDSDGKLLHSQGTGVLEEGHGYSEKAMLDFLAKWAPESR